MMTYRGHTSGGHVSPAQRAYVKGAVVRGVCTDDGCEHAALEHRGVLEQSFYDLVRFSWVLPGSEFFQRCPQLAVGYTAIRGSTAFRLV